MDHLSSFGSTADHRFQDAPFADERNRYLRRSAAQGARASVLKIKRNELLWIARHLDQDAARGVGLKELLLIAQQRQNLLGSATAARRVIDIGRPWLRFRHTAAVHRVVAWYRTDQDVQRLPPQLATYFGHIDIRSTQRYLRMTPEILQAARQRFAQYAMGGDHEG
jgi:hypothetical protein